MKSIKVQERLNGILANTCTAQDIRDKYGVTAMTVHLWRERGLPAVIIPGTARPTVRFVVSDVEKWTKEHGIEAVYRPLPRYRPELAVA